MNIIELQQQIIDLVEKVQAGHNKDDYQHLSVEFGSTYAKIVSHTGYCSPSERVARSVYGFIVLKDTKKFKTGDILKAATWKAPATNFARGHIDQGANQNCFKHWTGVM